ncbi:MAG: tRNA (N(6)-L-threonylcarbamoyladenosine(37)-C(2))-methylthiotransferase MtaB [Candidatus Zixiibacteriota bacterium]|nr:MAG: tRNA (N(6)-L-threonylcarbamoyladenosine(37)-C(2))-methylthiotransferase MtaB [candidate division Zixibacteria bacterium]
MKRIAIQTVGCRLNQYESERVIAQLAAYGMRRALPTETADLYIINTCTVTHRADSNCRNLIRRAVRANPAARIVVVGCYVDAEPELIEGMEGVDLIIGNKHKDDIGGILVSKYPELFDETLLESCPTTISDFFEHNRAWIKISDGCNQSCSYCIVTRVRGRLVNRPVREILDEINALVANGYREVVLTGVHIGHFRNTRGEPPVKNLAALCRLILTETDIYRLRVSSIEPQTIRDDFLQALADLKGSLCHHLHVPLQSGSDRILKLMRRPYTPAQYLDRIRNVKIAAPETIIGADIIVGFPGETETDFQATRDLTESGLIDYLHVFSYSDRKGTPAADMPDKVRPDVIKERNAILTEVSDRLRRDSHNRQVGRVLDVISEHKKNEFGDYWGISGNYIRVKLPGHTVWGKEVVPVRVARAYDDYVDGDVIIRP